MAMNKYLDPEKAVREILDWVYEDKADNSKKKYGEMEYVNNAVDHVNEQKFENILSTAISSSLSCDDGMAIISSFPKDDFVEQEETAEETSPEIEVKTVQQAIDEADKNGKKRRSDGSGDGMEIISSLPKDDVVEKEVSAEETSPGKEVETEQQAIDEVDKNGKKRKPVLFICKCVEKQKACKICKKSNLCKVNRKEVNESFWWKDFVKRRAWFDAHIKIMEPTRRTSSDTITGTRW